MGYAFVKKMTTIIELHSGRQWKSIDDVIDEIRQSPKDGFYYLDENGKPVPSSPIVIRRAIRDAAYWQFLEVEDYRSRLTEIAVQTKKRGRIEPKLFESTLAVVLENKTEPLTDHKYRMDVRLFLNTLRDFPLEMIPDSRALWDHFAHRHPEIFHRKGISVSRFKQLLDLLGRNGSRTVPEFRLRIYLHPDDPRFRTLSHQGD